MSNELKLQISKTNPERPPCHSQALPTDRQSAAPLMDYNGPCQSTATLIAYSQKQLTIKTRRKKMYSSGEEMF
jgi:hypothetical protein